VWDISGRGWSGSVPLGWWSGVGDRFQQDGGTGPEYAYFEKTRTVPSGNDIGAPIVMLDRYYKYGEEDDWVYTYYTNGHGGTLASQKETQLQLTTAFLLGDRYLSYDFNAIDPVTYGGHPGFEHHHGIWQTNPYLAGYQISTEEWLNKLGQ